MLRRAMFPIPAVVACFVSVLAAPPELAAHPPSSTIRYPRVYGATGHLYGPTQAHYQYLRQYGRPWHGYGGNTATFAHNHFHVGGLPFVSYYGAVPYNAYPGLSITYGGGYGYGTGLPGYANYGPVYSYLPMAPLVMQAHPLWIGPDPFDNDVLKNGLQEEQQRWKDPLNLDPDVPKLPLPPTPSTPEARLKSIRSQGHGDRWMQKQEFVNAYNSYKKAAVYADDRAEAHIRLGYALVALGRFPQAVRSFKRGLEIDPAWPALGPTLDELLGPDSQLLKSSVKHKVAQWVREDIRDPDRLFVFGIVMYFDEDERALQVFETALRLAGEGEHFKAFLRQGKPVFGPGQPVDQPDGEPAVEPPDGAPPEKDAEPGEPDDAPLPLPPLPDPPGPDAQ